VSKTHHFPDEAQDGLVSAIPLACVHTQASATRQALTVVARDDQPIARRVSDGSWLRLIKLWLKMPVEEEDERGREPRTTQARKAGRGTPPGAPM